MEIGNMNGNEVDCKQAPNPVEGRLWGVSLPDWTKDLPFEYSGKVVIPVRFECFEEPSAHARKVLGNDRHGRCCYYHHQYSLMREVVDDEDNFYQEEAYWEEISAWRLAGGNWLQRSISSGNAGSCRDRKLAVRYKVVSTRPR
jgi:CxxC motif-containing protein (DUF1111 family)